MSPSLILIMSFNRVIWLLFQFGRGFVRLVW